MNFPTEVKDAYTGLDVTTTGCQVINGTTALELVRSRHLYYMDSAGYWEYDGQSDFSRIQRQDSFFRAVLAKINTISLDPFTINAFIGAAVGNLTIDDTFTKNDMFNLAQGYRGLSSAHLVTETLPTTALVTSGGADVLLEAQPYAKQMIAAFNQIGTSTTATTAPGSVVAGSHTTSTTRPTEAHRLVTVNVLNASTQNGIAHATGAALGTQGFTIGTIGDAPTPITEGSPSQILYGPTGYAAAVTLSSALSGPVSLVPDATLSGQSVTLLVAGSQLSVSAPGASGSTAPSTPTSTTSTTTTTIPADVYTNTQPEPWNPTPCTLGQPVSPATPTSTTVKAAGSHG